jgi:hypothetical protein
MSTFEACFQGAGIYLQLGFEHILDPQGYDHILFVIALCANYRLRQWRRVLILVTAFTIGHSLTLALAVLDVLRLPADLIELLIPITILFTAINNLVRGEREVSNQTIRFNYWLALGFGFIHGMGFSNYLRALLGQEGCLGGPLLMFNLGLEAGQVIIVLTVLALAWLGLDKLKLPQRYWNGVISTAIALAALHLIWEKLLGG